MATITKQIKGFPLIKFKSRKIIESLQSGKIYLSCLKWFRDYENESGDMVIGDSLEGMLHVVDGTMINKSTGEHLELNKSALYTAESNSFVYCMSCINPSTEHFEYSELQKKDFKEFGDTALLILDSTEFLNRVRKAASDKGYTIYFNRVHYYDANIDTADIWFSLFQGIHNIAFWKRKEYEHQQEFRMLIPSGSCTDDHIELDIGDISDISSIFTTEQILTAIVDRNT